MTSPYPTQRFADHGKDGMQGDCWRTCIAGLTGQPRDDVPHFVQMYADDKSLFWWNATVEYVEQHVDEATLVCLEPTFPVYIAPSPWPVVIATGPSPRGDLLHAVLVDATTGDLVWDPHPSRAGLAGPPTELAALDWKTL